MGLKSAMKFLRTVRLDDSDEHVYAVAAAAGEPAITGTFVFSFSDQDPEHLTGKTRQAYVSGFLGLDSFGWSTVVCIDEIDEAEHTRIATRLAGYMVEHFGAPSVEQALPFAHEELAYSASLCDDAPGTRLVLQRHTDEEGVHEALRKIRPEALTPTRDKADWRGVEGEIRIWDMFPDDGAR